MNRKEIILDLIKQGFSSPTEIGLKLGFSYDQASSRVMSCIKKLLSEGKIIRKSGGKYYFNKHIPKLVGEIMNKECSLGDV